MSLPERLSRIEESSIPGLCHDVRSGRTSFAPRTAGGSGALRRRI